jgi:hypothetical protein
MCVESAQQIYDMFDSFAFFFRKVHISRKPFKLGRRELRTFGICPRVDTVAGRGYKILLDHYFLPFGNLAHNYPQGAPNA